MKAFSESSYSSQVRRLRKMAEHALTKYPLKNCKLKFINHGENATFKVITREKDYLLRLHRNGYHSYPALLEELSWLKNLSKKSSVPVQRPVLSKNHKLVEKAEANQAPPRYCSLLYWQYGQMRFKNLAIDNFHSVGELTGRLHASSVNTKIKHRNYWTADGLLGKDATFGSLFKLSLESRRDYDDLHRCRRMIHAKLKAYQNKYPEKMALIHADLHFGNMIWSKSQIHPIDFDDCGLGFYIYDLAVTIYSCDGLFRKISESKKKNIIESLLIGYANEADLSADDIEILPYFVLARKLAMVAWLNRRRDNPKLAKHFDRSIGGLVKQFRGAVRYGVNPIL